MKAHLSFARGWVVSCAFALVLLPPIHFHHKQYFWAEIFLVPLFFILALCIVKRSVRWPTKNLFLVWLACGAAFVVGNFRGDLGHAFSIYAFNSEDSFLFTRDVVPFLRWSLIFATPWLLRETLSPARGVPLQNPNMSENKTSKITNGKMRLENAFSHFSLAALFIQSLKVSILISAVMSFADYLHLISLAHLGYFADSLTWAGRSYGTFTAPLEAGMVYGLMTLFLGMKILDRLLGQPDMHSGSREVARSPRTLNISIVLSADFFIFLVVLAALMLTKTGTSFVAMYLAFLVTVVLTPFRKKKWILCLSLLALAIFLLSLPPHFLVWKYNDFIARPQTWGRWVHTLPSKPLIALFGIGFSQLIVDNSLLTILIKGGIFLFAALTLWMHELQSHTPPALRSLFIFWGISWLALDSLGYWGIGRIMWILWGLCQIQTDRTHESNRQASP